MQTAQSNNSKIARLPVFDSDRDLQKFLEINFTDSLKQLIRLTVKTMVKSEMDDFRKQFEDKLHFNGYYDRNMLSTFGKVENIPIPRFRQNIPNLDIKSLDIFDDQKHKFVKLIEQMHLLGISQRKVSKLVHNCFGVNVSKNMVGSIHKELVENEQININSSPLDDNFEFLLVDGLWEITKGYGWDNNKSVLLCILGIKPSGERKIIGFKLARHEDTESWNSLLKEIKHRGLLGKNLKLIITDDTASTKSACAIFYPNIKIQNCIVHKMRNVFGKTSRPNKKSVARDVSKIFSSSTKEEALLLAKQTVKKWYLVEPAAMESLKFNFEYCLTYFEFDRTLWSKIRTTNILEREFREVRRRIRVFDSTFQSEDSTNRYANSVFNYLNSNYPSKGLHTNA